MADNTINIEESFDDSVLRERRELVARFEEVARRASAYRSQPIGDWGGTMPVVIAPLADTMISFDESIGSIDSDLLAASLERSGLTADQLSDHVGVVSLATGSALELDVQELIQSGALKVPNGTDSVELLGRTHPGADFAFKDQSGEVIGLMNTKASDSYAIIAEHFAKHPDVNYVYATQDAAVAAAERGYTVVDGMSDAIPLTSEPIVVSVDVASDEYRQAFADLAASDDGGFLGLVDGNSVIDNLPWITLGVLAYRARRRHLKGMPIQENKHVVFRDSIRSGSVYGTSVALQAAGVPIPVTVAASMFSSAAVEGVFRVKDQWGALAEHEQSLATRATSLSKFTPVP